MIFCTGGPRMLGTLYTLPEAVSTATLSTPIHAAATFTSFALAAAHLRTGHPSLQQHRACSERPALAGAAGSAGLTVEIG